MHKVTILVGNVASGKSTFAWDKVFLHCGDNPIKLGPPPDIINQDELGSRDKCLKEVEMYLNSDEKMDLIIDRTNISKSQRKYFIDLAKKYNAEVHIIEFIADPEKCFERARNRKDHPTIKNDMSDEKLRSIIERFNKDYEVPEKSEGFNSHITIIVDPPSPS